MPAGVCIGPLERRQVGTLTCYLQDPKTLKMYLLTAEHVLAKHGQPADLKERIAQPGNDGPERPAGEVLSVVRESSRNTYADTLDEAMSAGLRASFDWLIAEVSPEDIDPQLLGVGLVKGSAKVPAPGVAVIKVGRSTGITRGLFSARFDRVIRFGSDARGYWARFEKLLLIESTEPWWRRPFVDSGDSGGPILLANTNEVIALAIGQVRRGRLWAVAIQDVLDAIRHTTGLRLQVVSERHPPKLVATRVGVYT